MLSSLALAAAVALRPDAAALTLDQARRVSPAALGDLLLAPGHPPIARAIVGVQGNRPPPIPGQPFQAPILLLARSHASRAHGFCEQTQIHIRLAAVPYSLAGLPAAPPASLTTDVVYRWTERAGCRGRSDSFFRVAPATATRALKLVRQLARLQEAARSSAPLPAIVSVEDREAPAWQAFARRNQDPTIAGEIAAMAVPVTDPRMALAALPLDAIVAVDPGASSWHGLLAPADRASADGRPREVGAITMGEWTVDLALEDGRIAVARLVRQMIPPF